MVGKEKKIDYFYLTPDHQTELIKRMDILKELGAPMNNLVLTSVLHTMAYNGTVQKFNKDEAIKLIKRVVPKGGKILNVSNRTKREDQVDNFFSFVCTVCRQVINDQKEENTKGFLDQGYICNSCLRKD